MCLTFIFLRFTFRFTGYENINSRSNDRAAGGTKISHAIKETECIIDTSLCSVRDYLRIYFKLRNSCSDIKSEPDVNLIARHKPDLLSA